MALVVSPPSDKKRVKVYELRNNDWFDRGTGFCTGRIVNVGIHFLVIITGHYRHPLELWGNRGLSEWLIVRRRRMSRKYTSSLKISLSACFWKHRLRKTMDIKNSKVWTLPHFDTWHDNRLTTH